MYNLRAIISVVVLAIVLTWCTRNLHQDVVKVSGRHVLVGDKPYLIKGVCYNPVSKGSHQRNFDQLDRDLLLMKEAGINAVRVYSPIDDKAVLDKFAAADIRVITGFGYNQNGYFDILSGSFIDYVEKYKSHPAILFWELGNEYNYHPEWFDGDIINWYTALNDAAAQIHRIDPSHPAATAHGELPDSLALAISPEVDIWGMNVYRWDSPEEIFHQWRAESDKPMYLSEAGADSYMAVSRDGYDEGENQRAQANAVKHILHDVFQNTDVCSGVALFSFADEWWKAGDADTHDTGGHAPGSSGVPYDGAANEEYWGIVTVDGNKKQAFDVVKEFYKNTNINDSENQ